MLVQHAHVAQPHPENRYHLRLHRARSVVLTTGELVEIRAAQRTFEGAYIRTALGQFSFALVNIVQALNFPRSPSSKLKCGF